MSAELIRTFFVSMSMSIRVIHMGESFQDNSSIQDFEADSP